MYSDVAVIVPARLNSKRLPRKLLAKIGEMTLIEHVMYNLQKLQLEHLYLATDSEEIVNIAKKANIQYIVTENCISGTDRVYKALERIKNKDKIKYVVNIQGDMPFISANIVDYLICQLLESNCDILTLATRVGHDIATSVNNVKLVKDCNDNVLYFSRYPIPYGAKEFLHHIGIYGFRVKCLKKFVLFTPSKYEKYEQLEQLRALENGMSIKVCCIKDSVLAIDIFDDLVKARKIWDTLNQS
ncbi:3-deoxy-manno-octulosonate cytidylyltransferase [Rickettsia endosymbiont of Cardiosporidium cionae]|uniref:3-deoxy-manno-octulosonate cytidylyltransferase n=1 Tax=Rickettsia endosymbiont of Cardiosporidium cionae TaxID=2777155 RepID=UPI0018953F9F|nr:3-deoxy-manno-octulosonate cytidylyltransferase [Rickettsia endosymbiont of Cardiosporidium cionae]KAF8818565.1 3-deoxy-manno-octulosonate cytidylyltransferase [Rickettsia endosymbiont of Cardiosporidium cionae]